MAFPQTGATWPDVGLALIDFARQAPASFGVTVLLPFFAVLWSLERFVRFMGAKRIQQLAAIYLERLRSHEKRPSGRDRLDDHGVER